LVAAEAMTREEIEQKMDELARQFAAIQVEWLTQEGL